MHLPKAGIYPPLVNTTLPVRAYIGWIAKSFFDLKTGQNLGILRSSNQIAQIGILKVLRLSRSKCPC